jgi:hypothetical protein
VAKRSLSLGRTVTEVKTNTLNSVQYLNRWNPQIIAYWKCSRAKSISLMLLILHIAKDFEVFKAMFIDVNLGDLQTLKVLERIGQPIGFIFFSEF